MFFINSLFLSIISDGYLYKLINQNSYIKNYNLNTFRDKSSLSFLIKKSMTQSDCIKLGIACEKIFNDLILDNTNFSNIKNIKNLPETDHLFTDHQNKIIYYAELKANINLDTEKSKSTYKKCMYIVKNLKNIYNDYDIKWCLLAYRYLNQNEIPLNIKNKYKKIKNNLYGINDYMNLLNIDKTFNNEQYIYFLNKIADKMI